MNATRAEISAAWTRCEFKCRALEADLATLRAALDRARKREERLRELVDADLEDTEAGTAFIYWSRIDAALEREFPSPPDQDVDATDSPKETT